MREFAKDFYLSPAWEKTRAGYFKYRRGLCEICLKYGQVVPGEIVHHKIHLNEKNIDDPSITLNWDNLQLVCREHHAALHKKPRKGFRYNYGPNGEILPTDDTPL